MKKLLVILCIALAAPAWAQTPAKYALVIGNGTYTGTGNLRNAVNDANDMAAALERLGFNVKKLINASLQQMDSEAVALKNRLSVSRNAYGFLFYAGHGVQLEGVNYLIPSDANIPDSAYLKTRAFPVQTMLDMLNSAGNALNVVVLDACRDLPAAWSRSMDRGLSVVGRQPADSIVVYATSAGSTAADGSGRNGLFTGKLLENLVTPGIEVADVFKRTGGAVSDASGRKQIPAVYNQFFGTAYLGAPPAVTPAPAPRPAPAPAVRPSVEAGRPPAVTRVTPNSAETGGLNNEDLRLVAASLLNDCLGASRVNQFIRNYASRNNGNPPVCLVGDFVNKSQFRVSIPDFSGALEAAIVNSGKMKLGTGGTNAALLISGDISAIDDRAGNTTVRTYFFTMDLVNTETFTRLWMGQNSQIKKVLTVNR